MTEPKNKFCPGCQAVVAHCIDFRIQKTLHAWLDKHLPDGYDLISLAGGIKRLLEDGENHNIELEEFLISAKLHHPKIAVLIQHEDCGAYGGSRAFKGIDSEVDFQKKQLDKAEKLLKKNLPDISVRKLFVCLSGKIIQL